MRMSPQELRTYHVATSTAGRRRIFQVHANANLMLALFKEDRAKGRYKLHEFVLMPEHIHLILTPGPEVSLEKAIQYIKGGFSFRLESKFPVWTASYNETQIAEQQVYLKVRAYIWQNPVAERLTLTAGEYPFSSAALPADVDPPPAWLQLESTRAEAPF